MKIIVITLLVCLSTTAAFSQKKASVKPKQKAKTQAPAKSNKKAELLTEETYTMMLELAGDSFDDGKPIEFTSAAEAVEVKKIADDVCGCFEANFETIKIATTEKKYEAELDKCMNFKMGLAIAAAAKKLGKSFEDEKYIESLSEKVGMQLLKSRCKPFLWLSMLQGINE
jgi:hypothetical protein